MSTGFNAWAASRIWTRRGLGEDTETVMRTIWGAFTVWCIQQHINATEITEEELKAFLDSREGTAPSTELTPRSAWRVVHLLHRVINHMASIEGRAPNRACTRLLDSSPDLRHANSERKDPAPEFLSDAEDMQLVSFIESATPALIDLGAMKKDGRWQEVRNRTSVALMRGAGLTPLEVRELTLSSIFTDASTGGAWKVRAPATGSVREHDAPLAKWARGTLEFWMRLREELEIPGDWLLPSTRTGKQVAKTTIFNGVEEVLDAAALHGFKGGGYLLRHTFAMRQLARPGATESFVAGWMGIDVGEMKRYRGVLMGPVEVV